MTRCCTSVLLTALIALPALAEPKLRTQRFDNNPGWEGHNNRVAGDKRKVRQDFGYSPRTNHAGGKAGEIGGFISPAAESAYYGRKFEPLSLDQPLTASGRFACTGKQFHILLGFFNSGTANEWRTASSLGLRLNGRGDVMYAYVEYCTRHWRAGGDTPGGFATVRDEKTGRPRLRGFPLGKSLEWSLLYDPKGNKGGGTIIVKLGDETSICHLGPGHKEDGARFDHFGLMPVLKSAATGGEVWLDDVTINGQMDDFSKDPGWAGYRNRRTYETSDIRPRFDFGYCDTRFAGGKAAGELGGLIFRGDCRYKERLASYGDRLEELGLDKPLRASGTVAQRRGVTDSTVLIGFYHQKDSLEVNESQSSGWPKSFLGVAIEGPSREGFYFYPAYRVRGDGQGHASGADRPRILPNGQAHDWSLDYDPEAAGGRGRITVKLGEKSVTLDLAEGHRKTGARFDRFGLVTTWIDGNGQRVYFDDLTYTCEQ